ncbi:hypothetical protein BVRB_7g157550 [Beta vulgaris subsp. vulgaris]|nr:hypothetical protein BVRB_7g157550 [Beta vulgaris subsp. vulgaris]
MGGKPAFMCRIFHKHVPSNIQMEQVLPEEDVFHKPVPSKF